MATANLQEAGAGGDQRHATKRSRLGTDRFRTVGTRISPRIWLTGNQHDAEDLTQDVFVKVFRSLAKFQPGNVEGWLHRITTNEFLDQVRRKQRIRMVGLPTDVDNRLADRRVEETPE